MSDEDNDDDDKVVAHVTTVINTVAAFIAAEDNKVDHRTLPRKSKTSWRHGEALYCIMRDHLGDPLDEAMPLLTEKQFVLHFCISRSRFRRLMADVAASDIHFYKCGKSGDGTAGACFSQYLRSPSIFSFGIDRNGQTDQGKIHF